MCLLNTCLATADQSSPAENRILLAKTTWQFFAGTSETSYGSSGGSILQFETHGATDLPGRQDFGPAVLSSTRSPYGLVNIRIPHSGSKAQGKGGTRNTVL